MIQQKTRFNGFISFMTSDSKDSHEGHVALEGCRHENLELVYHIQVALILSARPSQQSNSRKKLCL